MSEPMAETTSAMMKTAWKGFLYTILGAALLLFVPAGSRPYPQGWALLILLAVFSAATIIYFAKHDPALLRRRLKGGPNHEPRRSQQIIQSIFATILFALFILPGLDHRWRWSEMPVVLIVLGLCGVTLSFWIIFIVFRENSFASAVVEVANDQTVISTGPYGYVRHPMYLGADILFLSLPLALGSYWAFIPAIAACVMIAIRLLDEEAFLKANLPGYMAYCEKVRYRLLPGVW